MVLVEGGVLVQGSADFYPEEQPVREVPVGDLWVGLHPVTNAEFRRFVKDTGHVTVAEQAPDPADFPDADPRDLVPGSLVFTPTRGPGAARRLAALVALAAGGGLAASGRSGEHPRRPRSAPGGARRPRRCPGVRGLGGRAVAERGRMGVCRSRRSGRRPLPVGRGVHAGRPGHGQHLARRLPVAERAAQEARDDDAGRQLPAQRVRTRGRVRQRVGVDGDTLERYARRGAGPG